jgi:POT family proton-dependent oligopeptide transporter
MRSGVTLIGFILGSILIAVGLGGVQASVQPFIGKFSTLGSPVQGMTLTAVQRTNIQSKLCG